MDKLVGFPPLLRGGGGRGTKGEDISTSLTKASSDYASEWTRDPGKGGFILIKAQPLCGGWLFLFLLHLQKLAFDV